MPQLADPWPAITSSTFSRVLSATRPGRFRTFETVPTLTPARLATSATVTEPPRPAVEFRPRNPNRFPWHEHGVGVVRAMRSDTSRDSHGVASTVRKLSSFGGRRWNVESRLHDTVLYNSIYRADDDLLISPHAYAIPASHAPVLHLRHTEDADMATTYLNSFDHVWSNSTSPN